jgi:hypothetical protein
VSSVVQRCAVVYSGVQRCTAVRSGTVYSGGQWREAVHSVQRCTAVYAAGNVVQRCTESGRGV